MSGKANFNPEFTTTVNPKQVLNDYKQTNEKYMNNVITHPETSYKSDYIGSNTLDFGESQFMKNQSQAIIDSSREFLEMLRKAAEKRDANAEETVASSLVDVHDHISANSHIVLNPNHKKR